VVLDEKQSWYGGIGVREIASGRVSHALGDYGRRRRITSDRKHLSKPTARFDTATATLVGYQWASPNLRRCRR
jgi:hypothetical protein